LISWPLNMIKALAIFCLLFVYCNSEICFPWPQDEYVTGTVSNYGPGPNPPCCGIGDCSTANRAFYFQALQYKDGSGTLLGWDPTYSNTFVYDPVQKTITIQGRTVGITTGPLSSAPNTVFDVQLTFSGVGPCVDGSATGNTPIASLKQESSCIGQDVNGAEITPYCWYCSDSLSGTFTAPHGSSWYPTVFPVTNNMVSEFGYGADGGDANLGVSAWITIETPTTGPPNASFVVSTSSSLTNDLDCDLNCNSVCSIDIVYTPQCSSSCKKVVVFIGNDNVKIKKKEYILCGGECLILEEPAGTSIWLHERDHKPCSGECGDTEAIFKIDDICTVTCLNDPNNELQLIHNSGPRCGLPCPQNFLGPS